MVLFVSTFYRYIYEGEFEDGLPLHRPNQIIFFRDQVAPEPEDPKAKKDAKKGEPEEDPNPYKIVYEIGKTEPICFEIRCVFQGEPVVDDSPLDEEELKKQAAAKKGKAGDEPEVRMITPDPVIIHQESGREIEFEMGRMEVPTSPEVEGEPQPPVPLEGQEPVWTVYNFDQNTIDFKSYYDTEEGVVKIENLKFEIKDGLKGGKYDIIVRDVTNKIKDHLPDIKISLEIINPEEPPVPVKGKKK